jgi:tRNA(fMet)-specific endonuclease VapC
VPVLLDTDHLSVLQWEEQPACDRLLARLETIPPDNIATSIVSFHEQIQGWQAYIKRARKPEQIVSAYAKLEVLWSSFLKMNVLAFGEKAQERFEELRCQCPRLRALDLRIAGIALVSEATLLSRNLRDFRQVPDLSVEDWSK